MKIIDTHMHLIDCVAGINSKGELRAIGNGKAIYSNGEIINIIPDYLGDKNVTAESLIKLMDKYNVEKGVLLQGNYLGYQNYASLIASIKYPNRFITSFSFDPFYRNVDSIIDFYLKNNVKIIKLELSQTSGILSNHYIKLDDERLIKIYELAKNNNLILTLDIGRPNSDSYDINTLSRIIKNYPTVKFVICHLTAPQINDFEILKNNLKLLNYDNCYFDIASLHSNVKPEEYPFPTALKYIRYAIDYLGVHKLMFGSDVPSAATRLSYDKMISYIKDSNMFSEYELECLFYNNALEVYFK